MNAPLMGDRVRDVVTGREGVITGYCEYLWGCEQYLVYIDGEVDKEGAPKTEWFDIGRLDVTKRDAVAAVEYDRLETESAPQPRRRFFSRSATPRAVFSGPDRPAPSR